MKLQTTANLLKRLLSLITTEEELIVVVVIAQTTGGKVKHNRTIGRKDRMFSVTFITVLPILLKSVEIIQKIKDRKLKFED